MIVENHIRNIFEGYRSNERKSQKELYQLLHKYVFAICYRYEDKSRLVEKLANDSFIHLFKKLRTCSSNEFPASDPELKEFTRKMVIAVCINHFLEMESFRYRNETKEEIKKIDQSDHIQFSPRQIIEAIRKLCPECRAIYNLIVIDKISHEDAAAWLGISMDCSITTLIRARDMLRKSLHANELPVPDIYNHSSIFQSESLKPVKSLEKCFG